MIINSSNNPHYCLSGDIIDTDWCALASLNQQKLALEADQTCNGHCTHKTYKLTLACVR